MNVTNKNPMGTVQRFELRTDALYTLEAAAHLAEVPRRSILIYYMHGLVSPVAVPADSGYYFDDEAIRALRRMEFLRAECGFNLKGTQMVLNLMEEVERLRAAHGQQRGAPELRRIEQADGLGGRARRRVERVGQRAA